MKTSASLLFITMVIWVTLSEYSHGAREPYPRFLNINHSLVSQPIMQRVFKGVRDFIRAPFHRIIPATLWCGAGNISDENETLGKMFRTDSCCREHDHCEFNIPAGQSRFGLKNEDSFTYSACSCDHRFYDCLKTVNSLKSRKVGITFFNILSPKCFVEDYPITSCNKTVRVMFRNRCVEYNKDNTSPKVMQWNDNLIF